MSDNSWYLSACKHELIKSFNPSLASEEEPSMIHGWCLVLVMMSIFSVYSSLYMWIGVGLLNVSFQI